MRLIVRTNQLMPKGQMRGGGGDGFHEITCHPENVELAAAIVKQMAGRMGSNPNPGDVSFRVENSEVDGALAGVEIVHE